MDHRAHGYTFADGSICLFGHSPEHGWQPEYSGALALDRLRAFLEASDRGQFARVDDIPRVTDAIRVSVHPRVVDALRRGGQWGALTGHVRADGRLILITGAEGTVPAEIIAGLVEEPPAPVWRAALELERPWRGYWCRIAGPLDLTPPTRQQLVGLLRQHVPSADARKLLLDAPAVLLVDGNRLGLACTNPDDPMLRAQRIPALYIGAREEDIPSRIFLRVNECLLQAENVRRAHVAIIGLGSLGSGVALALAKAGVGKFVLFDPECLEPENVARHAGGVADIGLPKVTVMARAIQRINPEAEVVQVQAPLALDPANWSADSMRRLRGVLNSAAGLVVCTTATSDAERVVNAVAVDSKTPVVFGTVLGKAAHGRVFRVVPGRTACYQCVLLAQSSDPGRFPRFDGLDVGVPAYRQPGVPGLGMDIDQIALLVARLALQTIGERIEGGIGYPAAHGDHFIWSNHGGWAVDGPLQVRVERIPRSLKCPVCGPGLEEPLDETGSAELAALLAGKAQ